MVGIDLADLANEPLLELNSDSQGLATNELNLLEIDEWLLAEQAAWEADGFSGDVTIGTVGAIAIDLNSRYRPKLQQLRTEVAKGNLEPLKLYMQQAEAFEVLLLQSRLGASIRALDPTGRLFLATAFSVGVVNFSKSATKDYFVQARSLIAVNPFVTTGLKLVDARSLRSDTRRQLRQSSEVLKRLEGREKSFEAQATARLDEQATAAEVDKNRFEQWFRMQEKALEATRDIYHKHVQTEAAAKFWQRKALTSTIIAWVAFLAFGGMVGFALWVGWSNLAAIKSYVQDLANSSTTVSLTPIVVVTMPVLAYAWVLRHLSRVFIQNLTIADDAAYRRLMTMTFLGLSHDPKSGVTQAERAIILNALFRPAPPNTTEDGPPTGLLDIITKK